MTKESLLAATPDFTDTEIRSVLRAQYGIEGSFEALVSERDQNIGILTKDNQRFVLKIANSSDPEAVSRMQVGMLTYLDQQAEHGRLAARVAKLQLTTSGQTLLKVSKNGEVYFGWLVSWLSGEALSAQALSKGLCRNFGRSLAQLGLALQGYTGIAQRPGFLWDMRNVSQLKSMLAAIEDVALRKMLDDVINRTLIVALPVLDDLPSQAIHNDCNPGNVLLDPTLARSAIGFIDFGDAIYAPRIVDVAVAASYLRTTEANPWRWINAMLQGYQQECSLSQRELSILPLLIEARLCTTITLMYERTAELGLEDDYTLRQQEERQAEGFLRALRESPQQFNSDN